MWVFVFPIFFSVPTALLLTEQRSLFLFLEHIFHFVSWQNCCRRTASSAWQGYSGLLGRMRSVLESEPDADHLNPKLNAPRLEQHMLLSFSWIRLAHEWLWMAFYKRKLSDVNLNTMHISFFSLYLRNGCVCVLSKFKSLTKGVVAFDEHNWPDNQLILRTVTI